MTRRRHRRSALRRVELFFWAVAVIALGAYAAVYADRTVYQAYREWSFERSLEGEPAPVIGFVLESIRFGKAGKASAESAASYETLRPVEPAPGIPRRALEPDALIGRIEIPRVGVRAMVVHGTNSRALRRAVGHIEHTSLPGEPGNVGIAGHRDTFFRGLRDIQVNDAIRIRTLDRTYDYVVESITIVDPTDVSVLKASAGPMLTLVTCYPFEYMGSAPKRYVVQARESAPALTPRQVRGF